MPVATTFNRWLLVPPYDPALQVSSFQESASTGFILETLREEAEIASIGRAQFPGNLAQKNELWREYRNFLRQALSNFTSAFSVPNRSAHLLYYYAMLNFPKAELLKHYPQAIRGARIHHGLTFSTSQAKTVAGDALTVRDGLFRLLYEQRTGHSIAPGTRLPVRRLLAQIPEVSTQVRSAGLNGGAIGGLYHLVAMNDTEAWPLIAAMVTPEFQSSRSSTRILQQHFYGVDPPSDWRNRFGLSRRFFGPLEFYEGRTKRPYTAGGTRSAVIEGLQSTWQIKDILALTTTETYDALLVPSLYRTRLMPMPPSLARHAVTFYASSLVRYRPSMFDLQIFPEQAYLFDACARECALPMLIDTLSGIREQPHLFHSPDALRA